MPLDLVAFGRIITPEIHHLFCVPMKGKTLSISEIYGRLRLIENMGYELHWITLKEIVKYVEIMLPSQRASDKKLADLGVLNVFASLKIKEIADRSGQ